jgi:HJR/Mrr/RecB family endonuclease
MPRKNKSGTGKDQKGHKYTISYQPDWLKALKASRKDKQGKKDTVTVFKNPEKHQKEKPGKEVKTRVTSDEGVNFTITVDDPRRAIKRIRVEYKAASVAAAKKKSTSKNKNGDDDVIVYTLDEDQPPPPPPNGNGTTPGGG